MIALHKDGDAPDTFEHRIRHAALINAMHPTALIVLQLDADNARRAVVTHLHGGGLTLLCEPDEARWKLNMFRVAGDDVQPDPHALTVYPEHNEEWMRQFHGRPVATVSYAAAAQAPPKPAVKLPTWHLHRAHHTRRAYTWGICSAVCVNVGWYGLAGSLGLPLIGTLLLGAGVLAGSIETASYMIEVHEQGAQ